MLEIKTEGRFKKDMKRLKKSGAVNFGKLKEIIITLEKEEHLDRKYRPHKLSSKWQDHLECHIEPDWLLIYRIDSKRKQLILVRTGSHSDLFG
ncbi:MAG: type II toxin-antitoxin system YafQ family toxin [Chrysiogenales bacterium]